MTQRKPKKRRRDRHDPNRTRRAQQREEARRREREERAAEAAAKERRDRILKRVRSLALPALVGISVIVIAAIIFRQAPEIEGVERPAELDIVALEEGETFDYGTATPTSGPYAPGDPVCGVFGEPLAPERAVAALRVGAVVLWHAPDDTTTATALAEISDRFGSHVIVSPNDSLLGGVVATGWNRLLAYGSVDEGVEAFVDTYRTRGPEDGDCPG